MTRGAHLRQALEILRWLERHRAPFTAEAFRDELGLHRRTAYRWLEALVEDGMLECELKASGPWRWKVLGEALKAFPASGEARS